MVLRKCDERRGRRSQFQPPRWWQRGLSNGEGRRDGDGGRDSDSDRSRDRRGGGGAGAVPGAMDAANATSNAATAKGALAQAQSTAASDRADRRSQPRRPILVALAFSRRLLRQPAAAQRRPTRSRRAEARAGLRQSRPDGFPFSTALPDKAYATALIGGAGHVANALLGPRDAVFGTAIMGANTASDGGGGATRTARVPPSISAMAAICGWA